MRTHTLKARIPRYYTARVQSGPWKLEGFRSSLPCHLKLIFKHSDTKWLKGKNIVDQTGLVLLMISYRGTQSPVTVLMNFYCIYNNMLTIEVTMI